MIDNTNGGELRLSKSLLDTSDEVHIARHLYELSVHPQIKSGDLFIARISGMLVDGEPGDAAMITTRQRSL